MSYTTDQLDAYFRHIRFPRDVHPSDPLELLTALVHHQVARVPFESLSLHYSPHRLLSLDLQDLYDKVVRHGRGGYCMELNAFFGEVLRSMGYVLFNAGGRVWVKDHWTGLEHMVNIVTINSQRYFVDVAFGAEEAMRPVPMTSGFEFDQIPPVRGRIEHTSLPQHSDPSQRVWLYSTRSTAVADGEPPAEWAPKYHFLDAELFPADYRTMNLSPMAQPTSFFVQTVLAMRVILEGEGTKTPVGTLTMVADVVRRKVRGETEVLAQMKTEEERIAALEKYFEVVLGERERRAIKGLASELKG